MPLPAHPDAQAALRRQVGALLTTLRGDTPKSVVARELGITRQSLLGMESGAWSLTLDRLADIATHYGATLQIVYVTAPAAPTDPDDDH